MAEESRITLTTALPHANGLPGRACGPTVREIRMSQPSDDGILSAPHVMEYAYRRSVGPEQVPEASEDEAPVAEEKAD